MNKKGGLTIPVFHCIFNGYESITSFMRDFDEELYKELENLYAICISDNSSINRVIVAGLFVKTSYSHEDPEFLDVVSSLAKETKELIGIVSENTSLLPARIGVPDNLPLSENEMLSIMSQQFVKFSSGGNA